MRSSPGTVSGIYFESTGAEDASALIFSHPLGSDRSIWEWHVAKLARTYRVVCFDTRGHGRSSVPEQPFSLGDLGADVIRLLDHLSLARAHFCGASMGGLIGQWLGINSPGRLLSLTLADTAPQMGTAASWDERIAAIRSNGLASIADATMERWFTAGFRETHPEIVTRLKQVLEQTSAEGYIACARVVQAGLTENESYERLESLKIPVLVVTGAGDSAAPPEKAKALASRISGSRYLELPGAHVAPVESAELFLSAFQDLLRKQEYSEPARA
jgi:3-oxoadipate enol-lactonase